MALLNATGARGKKRQEGSIIGGILGGVAGSLLGPIGWAAGASIGASLGGAVAGGNGGEIIGAGLAAGGSFAGGGGASVANGQTQTGHGWGKETTRAAQITWNQYGPVNDKADVNRIQETLARSMLNDSRKPG